jgi:hypothetical protein
MTQELFTRILFFEEVKFRTLVGNLTPSESRIGVGIPSSGRIFLPNWKRFSLRAALHH